MSPPLGASRASRTSVILVAAGAAAFGSLMVTAAVVAVLFGVQP
ncbi:MULTISPECIES: hypothetical protein [unclassified Leifsonia]|nr:MULTISPECIES: hypothetical protein [unclassified Leifsonia]